MDSTPIDIECVEEIAETVGRKAEVAEITEATEGKSCSRDAWHRFYDGAAPINEETR